jgi:hypothetical protein
VGCVIYELLTLEKAFGGQTIPQISKAILEFEPPMPKTLPELEFILEE